ncbi:MAG: hypothetical protein DRJ67_06235, partial [Thermoprotei archaeon]
MEFREINVVRKRASGRSLGVAVAYPSLYEAAVKSLSVQMLYFYLNSLEDVYAERLVLQRTSGPEPPARSIESGRLLRDFELILFSVHYEPDYVNIVRLLKAGGVPLLARDREQVVVVGGPPVIANPEPLSEVADVLVVGEIESTLPLLIEAVLSHRGDKRGMLDELPPEKGFYVPARGDERITYSYPERLPPEFHPAAQVQPADEEWRRTTMIEVSRGCPRGCRFCMEGHIFLPKRDRGLGEVLKLAEEGRALNCSSHVTLISLSFFDHPRADDILRGLVERGFEFSAPSLRLELLNRDRLELIAAGGQATLTLAPETASPRLAAAIGKPLRRHALVEVAKAAREAGFRGLKLYFMVGLPGEGVEEARGIVELVREVSAASGFRGVRELKVSLSIFVPKPQTPMQWFGMDEWGRVRRKVRLIVEGLGGLADVRPYKPAWAYVQCMLARGGRELAELLLQ